MSITPKDNILLVDDDPSVLLTVGDRLMAEGYHVIKADSGQKALSDLAQHAIDLVVLDIAMPGLSGLGFLKETSLHANYAHIPVLVFTARANLKELFDTVGTAGFIPKTAAPELLISAIKNILSQRRKTEAKAEPFASAQKILIVDDDKAVQHHLLRLFRMHGMDPQVVTDPSDILSAIATHKPRAILLKYLLSGISGLSIARTLGDTHHSRKIPVVLYDDTGIYRDADVAGTNVVKFIREPSDTDIVKAVSHALALN